MIFPCILFTCRKANSQYAIDQNVKCILQSLHDSDFKKFKICIQTVYNFEREEDKVWHFHFLKLVSFYKTSGLKLDQITYEIVPPDEYDLLSDLINVDVVIYDKHGQMDSTEGTLYGALHLGYDTTQLNSEAVLRTLDINDKYNGDYRDYLFKIGKLRESYPGLDTLQKK